jgi:hypothetical protein
MLNHNGFACIFMDSKDDTIKKVQDICESDLYEMKSNNIEDIVEYLNRNKITYNIYNENKEISGMLKDNKFTEKARIIISLVSWRKWSDIPSSTKISIKRLLKNISKNDLYPSCRFLIIIKKT